MAPRQQALLVLAAILLFSKFWPSDAYNVYSDRCDWQWKFYEDAYLRSVYPASTVDTWYNLEEFEIQTLPGGTTHIVLNTYNFGTEALPGVPLFTVAVPTLRGLLAFACSKGADAAAAARDGQSDDIELQDLSESRLRRSNDAYDSNDDDTAPLVPLGEFDRFTWLQYVPPFSTLWTIRDYADRFEGLTQSVRGLGRLSGGVAAAFRSLARFCNVPNQEMQKFKDFVSSKCSAYARAGSLVGKVLDGLEKAYPKFQYSQYGVYAFTYVVAPVVRGTSCWAANLDLKNADPDAANKNFIQVNWGKQPRPAAAQAASSRRRHSQARRGARILPILNTSLSNTSSYLVPPGMPKGITAAASFAPPASLAQPESNGLPKPGAARNSAVHAGRRMLEGLIGPAGLSPSYAVTSVELQGAGDSSGLGGTSSLNGTSSWQQPHPGRMLQEADRLNFAPLAVTVAAYQEVVDVVQFITTNILNPLNTAFKALQLREIQGALLAAKKVLDDLGGIFNGVLAPLQGILSKIADAFKFIKCPDTLSFICNIQDLIDEAVNAITKGLGLGTIDEWIAALVKQLNFPSFNIDLGPFKDLEDRLVNGVFGDKLALVEAELKKLARIADFSVFDPLAQIFNVGIRTAIPGVTAHYVSSISGSATFNCDRDGRNAYPGVFTAKRQVMDCEQNLGAYLRLPCPANAKSCTIDYASKYPLAGCNPQVIPDKVRQGLWDLMGLPPQPKFWFEDVFSSVYYCIDQGANIKLLAELFSLTSKVDLNDETGRWPVTNQRKHSMVPSLIDAYAGVNANDGIDCSGGGRQIYIEYVQAPAGSVDQGVWDPCMTGWRAGENAEHRSDFCWGRWGGLVDRSSIDDYDSDAWGYDVGGWQCEGDAMGIYASTSYSRQGGAFILGITNAKWRWHPNRQDALNIKARVDNKEYNICPDNCHCCAISKCNSFCGDLSCTCSVTFNRPGSGDAKNWCEGGYPDLSTKDFADTSQSYLQADSRRQAKGTRLAVMQSYAGATGSATAACRNIIASCNGMSKCSLGGCIPGALQYACVTPFTNRISENAVYVFGGSKRSTTGSFTCPEPFVARLVRAEYGAGFDVANVQNQLSTACSGRTCTFDITTLNGFQANTLLAVVECVCGQGYDLKPGDNGCEGCAAGSYRSSTMEACALCPAGSASRSTSATCTACAVGTFATEAGRSTCSPCPDGSFANSTGMATCFTCPTNTAARADKSGCEVCPAGTFTDGPGGLQCLVAPSGFSVDPPNRRDLAPCLAGTFASEGSATCLPCRPGAFTPSPASAQCFPCDKGYYTNSSSGNTMCMPCPRGATTQQSGTVLADGASLGTICTGLPTEAEVQAVLTASQATAAYSSSGCAALLAKYGGNVSEIGNGLCNPGVHNTPVCGYDGGDCCRSTCVPKNFDINSTFDQELLALAAASGLNNTPGPLEVIKAYGCSFVSFNCRDPDASAAGGGALTKPPANTPEPLNITVCPVLLTDPKLGNGVCEDLYNVAACSYDGGDCCPATCKFNPNFRVTGSCSDSSFNCRDTRPVRDTVPPVITGVPADLTVTSSAGPPNFTFVKASDNDPAYTGKLDATDVRVDHKCSALEIGLFLYKLLRGWSATDPSSNVSPSYNQTITVLDDEPPRIISTPNDTAVACDRVPRQAVLNATDNDRVCFVPTSVRAAEARRDGPCPYNYTLTRTWGVADAAGNTHNTSQTVQVFDSIPPVYPARDSIKGCLWPNNKLWYAFPDLAVNSIFGFGTINDACSSRNLTSQLVGCSTSLALSRSTAKGIDASNCKYDAATRVLKLRALRALDSTQKWIHNVVWRVTDECSNRKDYVAGIVVGSSYPTDTYTEYNNQTLGIWEVVRSSVGPSGAGPCFVAALSS